MGMRVDNQFSGASYRWTILALCLGSCPFFVVFARRRDEIDAGTVSPAWLPYLEDVIGCVFCLVLLIDFVIQYLVLGVCKAKFPTCPQFFNAKLLYDAVYAVLNVILSVKATLGHRDFDPRLLR